MFYGGFNLCPLYQLHWLSVFSVRSARNSYCRLLQLFLGQVAAVRSSRQWTRVFQSSNGSQAARTVIAFPCRSKSCTHLLSFTFSALLYSQDRECATHRTPQPPLGGDIYKPLIFFSSSSRICVCVSKHTDNLSFSNFLFCQPEFVTHLALIFCFCHKFNFSHTKTNTNRNSLHLY